MYIILAWKEWKIKQKIFYEKNIKILREKKDKLGLSWAKLSTRLRVLTYTYNNIYNIFIRFLLIETRWSQTDRQAYMRTYRAAFRTKNSTLVGGGLFFVG